MLRLPPFQLRQATSAKDAAMVLADDEKARVVAGGTDLYPNMKRRHQMADTVVSLGGLEELHGITVEPGGEIRIGAMTTLSEVAANPKVRESHPALARAVTSISSPVLRNMGTLGGNLCLDTRCTYYNQNEEWRRSINYCMKEAGEVCWVAPSSPRCWAISASDSAPMLCALGAKVRLVSKDDDRVIDLPDLYNEDGIDYLTKKRDEILTEVIVPPANGERAAFWKLRRRGSIDFAVLTVAPVVSMDAGGVVEEARIYMGAIKSFPSPATAVAESLVGKKLDEETIAQAAKLARKAAIPMDNTDFVARWRGHMTVKYMEAALRDVAGLEQQRLDPRHQLQV
jgi:4-hydroxybenzoyl-CoA reductase subunit beta